MRTLLTAAFALAFAGCGGSTSVNFKAGMFDNADAWQACADTGDRCDEVYPGLLYDCTAYGLTDIDCSPIIISAMPVSLVGRTMTLAAKGCLSGFPDFPCSAGAIVVTYGEDGSSFHGHITVDGESSWLIAIWKGEHDG